MLVISLCWRLFSLCWRFSQCFKSVTNISNLSPTHLVTNIRHQHRCNRLMIIQKVAMANLGISLEVYFSMFYHFYHGLLYCSMDRYGCLDGWGRFSGPMRNIEATVKRNIIWFLSIFNLGWASWLRNGILKERLILAWIFLRVIVAWIWAIFLARYL